jgi:transposase
MNNNQLFEQALQIAQPWYVEKVVFESNASGTGKELHIHLNFTVGSKFADSTGVVCAVHDTEQRDWQHLHFFEHVCYLHARVPRIRCSDGSVKQVVVPWARQGSGFTLLFEAYAMLLIEYEMPVNKVAETVGVVPHRIWRVFNHWVETALAGGRMQGVTTLGIDETSSKKGHDYVTVAVDMDRKRVLHVCQGRGAETVSQIATAIDGKGGNREEITQVVMDMSPSYISGVQEYLPQAHITFDKYHTVAMLGKALDDVRKQESKGGQSDALKRHKYTLLRNYENLSYEKKEHLEHILEIYPRLGKVYELKQMFKEFWTLTEPEAAEGFLAYWCDKVDESDIEPLKKVPNTLRSHRTGIINYVESRLTSGIMEGINNKIQLAKRRARGFRNTTNFINMIYFIAGKLNFNYPLYSS